MTTRLIVGQPLRLLRQFREQLQGEIDAKGIRCHGLKTCCDHGSLSSLRNSGESEDQTRNGGVGGALVCTLRQEFAFTFVRIRRLNNLS